LDDLGVERAMHAWLKERLQDYRLRHKRIKLVRRAPPPVLRVWLTRCAQTLAGVGSATAPSGPPAKR
jgi:hypothetical protein